MNVCKCDQKIESKVVGQELCLNNWLELLLEMMHRKLYLKLKF